MDQALFQNEWLETNGLGGWSSSTVSGCNTRGYHGILVSASEDPADRKVLLSRLDETAVLNNNYYELGCRDFQDTVHPQGYKLIKEFSYIPCPEWKYKIDNAELRKTLISLDLQNSVCIKYQSDCDLILHLHPFLALRDYHSRTYADQIKSVEFNLSGKSLCLKSENIEINFAGDFDEYSHKPCWHYRFFYARESERGLPDREDLLQSGSLIINLSRKKAAYLLISAGKIVQGQKPAELFEAQYSARLAKLNQENSEFLKQLKKSSEQFIVKRGKSKTVIAGYHWFADWGRDTLISLRGLTLSQQKYHECRDILKLFCSHIKNGLVPNRFIEGNIEPEYNSVDASLWLAVSAFDYYKQTDDLEFSRDILFPALTDIFKTFCSGTIYNIHVCDDGLLHAGDKSVQLTWMDAKIGDWVVTPRNGKAVEINALWYNFLNVLKIFAEQFNSSNLIKLIDSKIKAFKESFEKQFYNQQTECLFDVINHDFKDPSIRPNQIFALGLEYCAISEATANKIINIVRRDLLTVRGLRTLDRLNPAYKGQYSGNGFSRDSAYHQGTVWPWLLGLYIDALFRFQPKTAREEALTIVSGFKPHLKEACLGSISEIFDGDFPHQPKGAISQAWSVAEILRICCKYKINP